MASQEFTNMANPGGESTPYAAMAASEPDCTITRALTQPGAQPWWKRYACLLCTAGVAVVGLVAVLLAVFVGGRMYANVVIEDADITVNVTMHVTGPETIAVRLHGLVDNRAVFGGTLKSSNLQLLHAGNEIGTVVFPDIELTGGGLTVLDVQQTLHVTSKDTFTAFAVEALNEAVVYITLAGSISVESLGISFSDIQLSKQIELRGLDKFSNPYPTVLSTTIGDGQPQELAIAVECTIPNYSSLAMTGVGQLIVDVIVNDHVIGFATSRGNVTFEFGSDNLQTFDMTIQRTPENSASIDLIVSNYTSGFTTQVTLVGRPDSTSVPLLKDALSQAIISSPVPGITKYEHKLIAGAYGSLNLQKITTIQNFTYCPDDVAGEHATQVVYLTAWNHFAQPLTITSSDFYVGLDVNGAIMPFGYLKKQHLDLKVPPEQLTTFDKKVCLASIGAAFEVLRIVATNGYNDEGQIPFMLRMAVYGTLVGSFGEFADVQIHYTQDVVPVTMFFTKGGD